MKSAHYALGFYREGPTLKAVLIHREKGQIEIDLCRTFEIKEENNVKPLDILSSQLAGKQVTIASGLDTWDILVRELSLKLKTKRSILSILPFQLESLIPYPLEETILLPFFKKKDKETTEVKLFATLTNSLNRHFAELSQLGIDPDVVSSTPSALGRTAKHLFPSVSSFFIYHLGAERSCAFFFVEGNLEFSHSSSICWKQFAEALEKDLPEETPEQREETFHSLDPADLSSFPHLEKLLLQLQREFDRLLYFLQKKEGTQEIQEVFLAGKTSPLFEKFLKSALPSFSGKICTWREASDFAIPLGLALDALLEDSLSVQFRQGNFASPKPAQKRKKLIANYLLSCAVLTAVIGVGSLLCLKKKESALKNRLSIYRSTESIAYVPTGSLSEEISSWTQAIAKQKAPFPYSLSAPKVSDLLAWLSSHPKLKEGVEIKHVRYSLEKYPKLGAPSRESYQAKVELELSASTPKLAREFHDALLSADPIIDSSIPVTWDVRPQGYSAIFFLKGVKP